MLLFDCMYRHHPDINELTRHLREEQSHTEAGIQRLIADAKPKTVRRKVLTGNSRIRSNIETYSCRSLRNGNEIKY